MIKIYTLEPLDFQQTDYLQKQTGLNVIQLNRQLFPAETKFNDDVVVLVCRDRDNISAILDNCKNLKMVFIVSTGVEKLPFEKLMQRRVTVCNTGGINAEIMSEYAMGAILLHSTRMCENFINQNKHFWKKYQCVDSLAGRKLLIAGAGRTGQLIAKKAKAFDMYVIGVKRHISQISNFDEIISLDDMDGKLSSIDYIVCTLPSTPQTYKLFNHKRFSKMNKSAVFINISRGNLVVQQDLMKALRQGLIGGAVLDVFDEEPVKPDSEIWDCPNLLITPHSSGRLENFMSEAIKYAAANINAFVNGDLLPNKVDLRNGY